MLPIISWHNKSLLKPRTTAYGGNCRTKENCLLNNYCFTRNRIYRADIYFLVYERLLLKRVDACMQLKFHAICNNQVYYLCYAVKITKIYVKINTLKIHQVMKSKTEKFSFISHYQRHFIKLFSYFCLKPFSSNLTFFI